MRAQWEAARARLSVLLEEDRKYTCFLESVVMDLSRSLRFKRRTRGSSLLESPDFDRFVETVSQLRHQHLFFQNKLKPMTEHLMPGGSSSVAGKWYSFIEIVADMLSILRVHYGQLFCRSEAIQAALDAVLGKAPKDWDGVILDNYLREQQLSTKRFVDRPLKRFNELVEFVEALGSNLTKKNGDGADSDATKEPDAIYASQMVRIVQENKHYLYLAKAAHNEEEELILLQTSFRGDGAEYFDDLSANKVLLHGEVVLSEIKLKKVVSESIVSTGSFTQPETVYLHCFLDGSLVCSKRQVADSNLASSFLILRHFQLKQNAIFLEQTPTSISRLMSPNESHALALILQDTVLVFLWRDSSECQRWSDTIEGLLEVNGLRTEVLRKDRTKSDLPLPKIVEAHLVKADTLQTEFASFFDDHLAGIFWVACGGDSDSTKPRCELVEVVFYARWLIVYKVNGWKRHSVFCQFDSHEPMIEISEQPHGDKEWSLRISDGSASSLILVSTKRSRIDFWYDRLSKAVESAQVAARRPEREKCELQKSGKNKISVIDENYKQGVRVGIKRMLEVVSDKGNTSIYEQIDSSCKRSPAGSSSNKSDGVMDKSLGEHDQTSPTIPVKLELFAERNVTRKSRRLTKKSELPISTASVLKKTDFSSIASPVVKNPKKRWMRRKVKDPDHITQVPTQPSPNTSHIASCETTNKLLASGNEPKLQKVRIILTGVELTASIQKKINLIAGAVYVEDITKATHVLAPKNQLKRTVKLLCGISCCAHILDVRWLDESARVGTPIFEESHCLKDMKAEGRWQFNLRKTMYDFTTKQRQQLFAGQEVFITDHKSVLPPVKDLVKIVKCAGGTAVTKGRAHLNSLVITSETALGTESVRKTLAQADPQRIYTVELIMSSILQQRIDFDKNRLERLCGEDSCRRK